MIVRAERLYKYFGKNRALNNLSVTLKSGTITGLLGPNGAGKTTFLRILSSYVFPSSGKVEVCGKGVEEHPLEVRRRIGYLPENVQFYEEMTVASYLLYRGRLKGLSGSALSGRLERVLDLCALGDVTGQTCFSLSRGYRKRLGIADTLLADPELLLLDEPDVGLDPEQMRKLRELLTDREQPGSILLSTHSIEQVKRFCDRVLIMNEGKIVYEEDLTSASSIEGPCTVMLAVCGPEPEITSRLKEIDVLESLEVLSSNGVIRLRLRLNEDRREEISSCCAANEWPVRELRRAVSDLEETYLDTVQS